MTIITASILDNAVRTQYEAAYIEGAMRARLYDQLASPVGANMAELGKGSTVTVNFLSQLSPSDQTISTSADITPAVVRDATATLTPTSRANAIQIAEVLNLQAYTDLTAKWMQRIGQNMMESIDNLAMDAAIACGLTKSAAARASLDAGTAGHRLGRSAFTNAEIMLQGLGVPGYVDGGVGKYLAIFHPWAYADLLADSVVLAVGEYQDKRIVLNNELGELGRFKLIVSPWAKVLYGAGADNGTNIATTLSAAASALDTTVTVTSGTNIAAGMRIAIGTEETAGTFYDNNESVYVKSVNSTTITIIGSGENGGLKYDHASGVAFRNADNVIPVIFGGPESLAKVYATEIGEYGQVVGPKRDGLVDQWETLGWKYYGGYGVISDNRLLRSEVSTSLDA